MQDSQHPHSDFKVSTNVGITHKQTNTNGQLTQRKYQQVNE